MKQYNEIEFVSEFKTRPWNFFKGNEGFLVMDRDWGEHSHHRSTGRLLTYIERGNLSLEDLTKGMNAFIGTLDKNSKEDFFQFTASACYIYCSIYDVDFYPYKIEDDFFLPGHACYSVTKEYVDSITFDYHDQHYASLIKNEYPQSGLANILL